MQLWVAAAAVDAELRIEARVHPLFTAASVRPSSGHPAKL